MNPNSSKNPSQSSKEEPYQKPNSILKRIEKIGAWTEKQVHAFKNLPLYVKLGIGISAGAAVGYGAWKFGPLAFTFLQNLYKPDILESGASEDVGFNPSDDAGYSSIDRVDVVKSDNVGFNPSDNAGSSEIYSDNAAISSIVTSISNESSSSNSEERSTTPNAISPVSTSATEQEKK